jgi:hypothetical protein
MRCSAKRLLLVVVTVLGIQICFLILSRVGHHSAEDDDVTEEAKQNLQTTTISEPISDHKAKGMLIYILSRLLDLSVAHSCV